MTVSAGGQAWTSPDACWLPRLGDAVRCVRYHLSFEGSVLAAGCHSLQHQEVPLQVPLDTCFVPTQHRTSEWAMHTRCGMWAGNGEEHR